MRSKVVLAPLNKVRYRHLQWAAVLKCYCAAATTPPKKTIVATHTYGVEKLLTRQFVHQLSISYIYWQEFSAISNGSSPPPKKKAWRFLELNLVLQSYAFPSCPQPWVITHTLKWDNLSSEVLKPLLVKQIDGYHVKQ